jgi:hypothetical protein
MALEMKKILIRHKMERGMKTFSIVFTAMMVMMVMMTGSGWAQDETITKGSVPKDRTVYSEYEKAKELYDQGKYHEAIDILEDYVKTTPDPWGYWLMGYSHYKLGEHDIANKYFRQAFLVDPSFTPTPTIEREKKAPYKDARPKGYPKGAKRPVPADTKLRLEQGTKVVVEPAPKEPTTVQPEPATVQPSAPEPEPAPGTSTEAAALPTHGIPAKPVETAESVEVPPPPTPGEVPPPPTPGEVPPPPTPGEVPPPPATVEPMTQPQSETSPGQPVPPQPEQQAAEPSQEAVPEPPTPSAPAQSQQAVQTEKPDFNSIPFDFKSLPPELTPENLIAIVSAMILVLAAGFVIASIIAGVFIFLLARQREVRMPVLAFVPIFQFWTLASCARSSVVMTLLLFLMQVTLILMPVAHGIIFMRIAEDTGRSKVLGLLLGLFASIVPLIWFAFSKGSGAAAAGSAMGGMGQVPDLSGEPQVPDLDFDLEEDDSFGGAMEGEPFSEEPMGDLPEMPDLPDETFGGGETVPDDWSLPQDNDHGDQSVDDWTLPQDDDEGESQTDSWSLEDEEDQ